MKNKAPKAALNFDLHPAQLEIFQSPARFKVAACGRRFGKSHLAVVAMLIEALKDENEFGYDLRNKDVFYVAPTFQQAKDTLWGILKHLGRDVIAQAYENTAYVRLINGRRIQLKGSDRPDTLRGVGLSYAVLDEYATMKPETWETILRPTLADVKGGALFIGTPAGKNHFFEIFCYAGKEEDWEAFTYKSTDNPFLARDELEAAARDMSRESYKQEFEASFAQGAGIIFTEDMFKWSEKNEAGGSTWMAVDPAGFSDLEKTKGSKFAKWDDTAIAIVDVGPNGWYVHDVITGRWGIRETSLQILRACQRYQPMAVGIEQGSLRNALMPYLTDQSRRLGIYPNIIPCVHGGKQKVDRITWALQGLLQHGRITFRNGKYLQKLMDQAMDFPSRLAHDDMLDALAYISQVAKTSYAARTIIDSWSPDDFAMGY